MQKPSIGRIVHYILANGQHRAATVVNAFGGDRCNLTVHLDGMNDLEGGGGASTASVTGIRPQGAYDLNNGSLAAGSVAQDEDEKKPGTWHWPEREDGTTVPGSPNALTGEQRAAARTVATRAKFTVTGVNQDTGTVTFHPVYSSDPNSENAQFFAATPNGEITLRLVRNGVLANFTPGEAFYVDFTPAAE